MSSSSSDEGMEELFGEDEVRAISPSISKPNNASIQMVSLLTDKRILPKTGPIPSSSVRIIKLPASSLGVDFFAKTTIPSGASIRVDAGQSNARLVEWEDGSLSLVVGSEHFRIMQRKEEIFVFDRQQTTSAQKMVSVSVVSVASQLNVLPGSLDSRTHKRVVEKSAVTKKLNEARKVYLATGHHAPVTAAHTTAVTTTLAVDPTPLTADFLEEGVKALKSRYRRGGRQPAAKKRVVEEDEDDEEEEEEEEEEEDESESSSADSSDSSAESSSDSD